MNFCSKFSIDSVLATRIFLLIFVVPRVVLIYVIGPTTAFAPDERNYLEMYGILYNSNVIPVDYPGWPTNSRLFLQIIYAPAKVFELIGIDALYANRVLSLLLSTATFIVLFRKVQKTGSTLFCVLLIVFFSTPSMLLWTILGIREPFIFLIVTLIFSRMNLNQKIDRKGMILLIFLSCGLYLTKTYLFVYFAIAICIGALVLRVFKLRYQFFTNSKFPIILILVPFLLFPKDTLAMISTAKMQFVSQMNTSVPSPSVPSPSVPSPSVPSPSVPSPSELEIDRGQTLKELRNQLSNNQILSKVLKMMGASNILAASGNKQVEKNWINSNNLNFPKGKLSEPLTIISSSFFYLILPTPFRDNGSLIMNLLSYEFFIWLFMYLLIFRAFSQKYRSGERFSGEELQSFLFLVIFTCGSGLVETNLGTSLRHRAVLGLVIFCLIRRNRISSGRIK